MMLNLGKFAGLWSGLYRGTTEWEVPDTAEWTVPVTGWYQIDLRGGGGGGGQADYMTVNGAGRTKAGGSGGNSRQIETHLLKKGDTHTITIGKAGAASTGKNGGDGGTSSFGDLMTIRGGKGGTDAYIRADGYSTGGEKGASYGNATPDSRTPGDGGSGGYMYYYEGSGWYSAGLEPGIKGGCYIKYLGQGATG